MQPHFELCIPHLLLDLHWILFVTKISLIVFIYRDGIVIRKGKIYYFDTILFKEENITFKLQNQYFYFIKKNVLNDAITQHLQLGYVFKKKKKVQL